MSWRWRSPNTLRGDPARARVLRVPTTTGAAPDEHGKPEEAVAEDRAHRIKLYRAPADNNLGLALAGQGKLEEAVPKDRTAIQLEPNLAEAHYNLGLAVAGQGKLEEAVAEHRAAIGSSATTRRLITSSALS